MLGFDYRDPAYRVFGVIVGAQGDREVLYISQEELQELCGISQKTLQRVIKRLVAIGYLDFFEQARPERGHTNGYSAAPLAKKLGIAWGKDAKRKKTKKAEEVPPPSVPERDVDEAVQLYEETRHRVQIDVNPERPPPIVPPPEDKGLSPEVRKRMKDLREDLIARGLGGVDAVLQ
jgi:hypothetical protein